ncbi:helix-turn-helix domain-containing protein [Acuticoccus sediminis]|uniref:hypothetical protein n=1 Tax=Acuticoccus sediminis TaxID=2184697 RepID=UPI001CFE985B|nr:hypothetical protein [Acuticoccus sediminis]
MKRPAAIPFERSRSAAAPAVAAQPTPVPLRDFRLLDVWRAQIVADRDLTGTALRVAIRISHAVNRERGYAFPGHQALAEGLCSRATLQRALRQLEARGHLIIVPGRGRGNANRYFVRVRREAPE